MPDPVLANRLAALATALDDAVHAETDDLSPSAVAALQTIRQDGPLAIQDVAKTIGLTHSATVRLIDRLEKDWLVRRLSRKGREVRVEVTARGRRRAAQFQDKRLAVANGLLDALDPAERQALAGILDKLLAASVVDPEGATRTCRSCEREGCRKAGCPVEAAARALPPAPPPR
ncbi:MAG: MarR family transcriptional regulator [Phyllobacteriaceae bacterium]|nr:MarR family transcriptional regulator [Phyllobacteriaceae bacterium]